MRFRVPHPIPYQGSKRQLADAILSYIPQGRFDRMLEPFAGSAAVTLAAAKRSICREFLIADMLKSLAELWREMLSDPEDLARGYRALWQSQFAGDPIKRFYQIREDFNRDHDPAKLLFLLARCVKNAVRFSRSGEFNQSPDVRRRGTHPDTMEREIKAASKLLRGRCEVQCGDFRDVLRHASARDVVYMDPPYEGTSSGRDRRYYSGVPRAEIEQLLRDLNRRDIQFLLSYDGYCGGKTYGEPLPENLEVERVLLEVGPSSQATLNGHTAVTVESVYVSKGLRSGTSSDSPVHVSSFNSQKQLFL